MKLTGPWMVSGIPGLGRAFRPLVLPAELSGS